MLITHRPSQFPPVRGSHSPRTRDPDFNFQKRARVCAAEGPRVQWGGRGTERGGRGGLRGSPSGRQPPRGGPPVGERGALIVVEADRACRSADGRVMGSPIAAEGHMGGCAPRRPGMRVCRGWPERVEGGEPGPGGSRVWMPPRRRPTGWRGVPVRSWRGYTKPGTLTWRATTWRSARAADGALGCGARGRGGVI